MATTPKRIYVVTVAHSAEQEQTRLVRAASQAQAIRHVADQTITAEVATQDDLVDLVGSGIKVEECGAQAPDATTT